MSPELSPRLIGIDVSEQNGDVNWEVAADRIQFAYLRASNGINVDTAISRNLAECARLSIPFGVYHAFDSDQDPIKQVELFRSFLQGPLPPMIDVEPGKEPFQSSQPLSKMQQSGNAPVRVDAAGMLFDFIKRLSEHLQRPPLIYTSFSYWKERMHGAEEWASGFPLWIAHYNVSLPQLPPPWTQWKFWQWSKDGDGPYYGCQSRTVDLNRYAGSFEEFANEFSVTPSRRNLEERLAVVATPPKPSRLKAARAKASTQKVPLAPIKELEKFSFSPGASRVIELAKKMATGQKLAKPMTSSTLLFGLADAGKSGYGTAGMLFNYLSSLPDVFYEGVRRSYVRKLSVMAGAEPEAAASKTTASLTPNTLRYLQRAQEIAAQLQESQIHTRHLLGALLEPASGSNAGFLERFKEMNVDLEVLREEFLYQIRPFTGGSQAVWMEILLGKQISTPRLGGFSADAARGPDLIGIDQEVNAFAALIAAQSVAPPLSIGLFGEWGSGKTFFMKRLRDAVNTITREMQEKKDASGNPMMQSNLPFYKRIAQIEFNAWHYVEGNLWASLVEHIFSNLNVHGDDQKASEALRKHFINELGRAKEAEKQASQELLQAEIKVRQVEDEIQQAKGELERKITELASLYKQQDLKTFFFDELKEPVENLVKELGLDAVVKEGGDMAAALSEAQAVLEGGNAIWTPLVRAQDADRRWRALMLSLVAVPVAVLVLGLIPALLGQQALAQIAALAGGVGAFLGAGARWLRDQMGWISKGLEKVEAVQQKYNQKVAEELAGNTEKIKTLEQQQRELYIRLEAAQQRKTQALNRVAEAQAKVDQATVTNLLADFIRDRADSNDYRKHLGLLALVRQDFEKLSSLMEEQNFYLAPSASQDTQSGWDQTKKYKTLQEEQADEKNRISRIVLYIDDLDRCPPDKVVSVLQAVHLLLAFPLFVVVVGVDARWVTQSLKTRYRQLQSPQDGGQSEPDREELIGRATPTDYMEKIFQIPYWLRPMDRESSRRMIDGLLSGQVIPRAKPETPPTIPDPNRPFEQNVQAANASLKDQVVRAVAASEPPAQDRSISGEDSKPPVAQPVASSSLSDSKAPQVEQLAENLSITSDELQFMEALSPLLERSPRALKRFINVYRLVKTSLPGPEVKFFLRAGVDIPDYQAVQFLLAVDNGLPDLAQHVFSLVADLQPIHGQSPTTVLQDMAWLVNQLEQQFSAEDAKPFCDQWEQLKEWLAQSSTDAPDAVFKQAKDLTPLSRWVNQVSRFSFQVHPEGEKPETTTALAVA